MPVNSRSVIIVTLNYNFDYFFVISLFHTLQRKILLKKQKQNQLEYIRIKTMKYKRNICIYAYLHNLCKLVILFITIKTWI